MRQVNARSSFVEILVASAILLRNLDARCLKYMFKHEVTKDEVRWLLEE